MSVPLRKLWRKSRLDASLVSFGIIRPKGRADLRYKKKKKTEDEGVRGFKREETALLPIQMILKNKYAYEGLYLAVSFPTQQLSQSRLAQINTFNTFAFLYEGCKDIK